MQAPAAVPVAAAISSRTYAYYVVAVLFLAYSVNVMDRSVLAVLLESIKHEFVVDDKMLGLLSGMAFALFYATLGIPIAALADRTSRRSVLAAATALCRVSSIFIFLLRGRLR